MNPAPWLEIDLEGYAQTLHDKGIERIALEPISNALDTDATHIEINFKQSGEWATLTVSDNDPKGFSRLADAWTLYAPSVRKSQYDKRGRFGQGEKELIAICFNGGKIVITSTQGQAIFDHRGRTVTGFRNEYGSDLSAAFRCDAAQAQAFTDLVKSLLVPKNLKVFFNSQPLNPREPVREFTVTLPSINVDEIGNLRPTRRQTTVSVFDPEPGEQPMIYELGIPVVEHDARWHVNIEQKVPLNRDRNNVTPAYLRELRIAVLNETHDLITSVDGKAVWVTDALPEASTEALTSVVKQVYGPKVVINDPSNPEASKKAIEQGYTVIYGRSFPTDVFNKMKEAGIAKPAGQVIQTGVPTSPDGKPPIPESEWTDEMKKIAEYTRLTGNQLLGFMPEVRFHMITKFEGNSGDFAAWWGSRTITFNLGRLGKKWPGTVDRLELDALLLHEFAHHFASDHYSAAFYNACCDLGAKLRGCPPKGWKS